MRHVADLGRHSYSAGKDLPRLSTLGHFLKGSSAAVGVILVRDGCEKMQHYVSASAVYHCRPTPRSSADSVHSYQQGKLHDLTGVVEIPEKEALSKIETTLKEVKSDYAEAEKALKRFYEDGQEAAGSDAADADGN